MSTYGKKHFAARKATTSGCLVAIGLVLVGCSRGPAPVEVPSYNPSRAADKALEIYDTDGDGFVAGEELENAPGLKAAMRNLDTNGDEKVSEEEIAERVRTWEQMSIGLMSFSCEVLMNGRPLEGAKVTFDPEEFLEGSVQAAVGVTSVLGKTRPKIPKEKRPSPDSPPGIQAGIYRVRISKKVNGSETIPAKYNSETTLGQEVSKDDRAIASRQVHFRLESN